MQEIFILIPFSEWHWRKYINPFWAYFVTFLQNTLTHHGTTKTMNERAHEWMKRKRKEKNNNNNITMQTAHDE